MREGEKMTCEEFTTEWWNKVTDHRAREGEYSSFDQQIEAQKLFLLADIVDELDAIVRILGNRD